MRSLNVCVVFIIVWVSLNFSISETKDVKKRMRIKCCVKLTKDAEEIHTILKQAFGVNTLAVHKPSTG